MPGRTMSFAHDARVERALVDRNVHGSRSETLRVVVERYEQIVQRMRPALTEAQWAALVTGLASTATRDPVIARALDMIVEDAVADAVDQGEIDPALAPDVMALPETIRALSFAERVAVLDELERRWARDIPRDDRGSSGDWDGSAAG